MRIIRLIALVGTLAASTLGIVGGSTPKHPVYTLRALEVQDGQPWEHFWMIDTPVTDGVPDCHTRIYSSLNSEKVEERLNELPSGSEIQYVPTSLPTIGRFDPNHYDEIRPFKALCAKHHIIFNDGFPVL